MYFIICTFSHVTQKSESIFTLVKLRNLHYQSEVGEMTPRVCPERLALAPPKREVNSSAFLFGLCSCSFGRRSKKI